MKKLLLILSVFVITTAHAQFPEGFEGATFPPTGWTSFIGTNGLGTLQNWASISGANTSTPPVNYFATGTKAARARYETLATGETGLAEDWLVTPLVAITAANSLLTFSDRQEYSNEYGSTYDVRVSSSSQTLHSSFTNVNSRTEVLANGGPSYLSFSNQSVNLSAYIGQSIYIAFVLTNSDGDNWNLDDVNFTAPASCTAPTLGLSSGITPTSATLTWTSSNTNFEILVQAASVAAPAANAPDGTGINVTGTSYTATLPTLNTAYSFYVRTECTPALSYSTWAGPFNFNNITPPDCATLTTPIDAATNTTVVLINSTSTPTTRSAAVALAWTAPTTPIAGYRIYFGQVLATLPILNSTGTPFTGVSVNITGILYNTTYYWKAVPETSTGVMAVDCPVYSFTTGASPGFCMNGVLSPVATFTPATCDGITINVITPTPIAAGRYSNVAVTSGQTYKFSSSVATDFFSLSTDAGLTAAGFGSSPYTWTSNFTGNVRVYVHVSNQCAPSLSTATRTTTVVCGGTLATTQFSSENFKSFPNPVKDILNLSYDRNINSISVINLLGQEVLNEKVNNNESKIDMSGLTTGAYMVKVTSDNEVKTIKVIKE